VSPSDLTRPLVRLLSDTRLRHEFRHDPAGVARRLSVPDANLAALLAIDRKLLERQARSLLGKRRFEVAKILPCTWIRLGDGASRIFNDYVLEARRCPLCGR